MIYTSYILAHIPILENIRLRVEHVRLSPSIDVPFHPSPTVFYLHPDKKENWWQRIGSTSGFLWGPRTTSQRLLLLSSHKTEKSSEGLPIRWSANEHITMSIKGMAIVSSGASSTSCSTLFVSDESKIFWCIGGTAPSAISWNEYGEHLNEVRSR